MKKRVLLLTVLLLTVWGGWAMATEAMYPRTAAGKVELKELPQRVALTATAPGDAFNGQNSSFGTLFNYIKKHDVAMTVPVEAASDKNEMSFYAGGKDKAKALPSDGKVTVKKVEPRRVVSAGLRGAYTKELYEQGVKAINAWLEKNTEWKADGEPYAVYWNSPFVPGFMKSSEVHQPVVPADDAATTPTQATKKVEDTTKDTTKK